MLEEISKLKQELEDEIGIPLTQDETAYLDQIKSLEDLKNYGKFEDLAYDAAIAMGLSDEAAESLIKNDETPDYSELEKEYRAMVSDVSILEDALYNAEYQMVEETSAEGFASDGTRQKIKEIESQLSEARAKLIDFKAKNSSFVDRYRAEKRAEQEKENERLFERFWNN